MSYDDLTDVQAFQVAPHIPAIGDVTEFTDKMMSLMAEFETLVNDANASRTDIADAYEDLSKIVSLENADNPLMPRLNMGGDHGTFLTQEAGTISNGTGFSRGAAFSMKSLTDIFIPSNSSDLENGTEYLRTIYNNTTFGGNQGEIPQPILDDWFPKMGGGGRYMPEFAIAEFMTGDGTSGGSADGTYRCISSNRVTSMAGGGGNGVSVSYYFQSVDGDAYCQRQSDNTDRIRTFIDGVSTNDMTPDVGSYIRLNKGEVYHLAGYLKMRPDEHRNGSLLLVTAPHNSLVRYALPWACSGAFQMMPHSRPVRSYGLIGRTFPIT